MNITAHMRIVLILTFLLVSNFGFSQPTKKLTLDSLKLELAKFLVEKHQIKDVTQNVNFYGLHSDKVDENLKKGIYAFKPSWNHSSIFFVIIEDNTFDILDISTLQGLKESINKTLVFSDKMNYCVEIIDDYISRLINVHYTFNKYPRSLINPNCKFEQEPTKSSFDLNSMKTKLAEFLIEKKEIKDIDNYFEYPDNLSVFKLDIYYGVEEGKNIACGVYTFAYIDKENPNFYYLILNEDWIDIFDIESKANLSAGINKILDFAENQKYCHLETGQIIKELIEIKYTKRCLDNPNFELP